MAQKVTALRMQSVQALARETSPVGRWREAVRGFSLSKWRSTIRLKDIAQVRAVRTAPTMNKNLSQPGHPRVSRAAKVIEANANGKAKTVCDSLTNCPHLVICEITLLRSNVVKLCC